MAFSLSPAVIVRENDLSTVVSAAQSTLGAFAGMFHWGPVNEPSLVSNEADLIKRFGYPSNLNYVDFFTLTGFFSYTSGAWLTRIGNANMRNAACVLGEHAVGGSLPALNVYIPNLYELNQHSMGDETVLHPDLNIVSFSARYPGQVGNNIAVSACASDCQYSIDLTAANGTTAPKLSFKTVTNTAIRSKEIPVAFTSTTETVFDYFAPGDFLLVDNARYTIVEVTANTLTLDRIYVGKSTPTSVLRMWKYANQFASAPLPGRFHMVVVDHSGYFQQSGAIIESYSNLSLTNAGFQDDIGLDAYYVTVINKKSAYILAGAIAPDTAPMSAPYTVLRDGTDAVNTIGLDEYITAYGKYLNQELYDVRILIGGNAIRGLTAASAVLANYLIYSVAEVRKDMLVFLSVPLQAVLYNEGREATDSIVARNLLGSSSYATLDSNWKYIYDKYNDTFRWVPCCGDSAGLYAMNDLNNDPWVSAAGITKGRLRNIVKLAWNADKANRDVLYPADINPVINLPVVGPVLFGDKTILGRNTALSRVNVRRLMIILEKAIATAAAELLFEFNDEFTQRRFVAMIDPILKDAKGRRGIISYKIIADSTVNTPQVVQNNGFVGQIYIKPNYVINDIMLAFNIVNASTSFKEITGSE